jgi:uncharacterized tellurite resistance protein B-like protein
MERLGLGQKIHDDDARTDEIALAATALLLEVAWSDHDLADAELADVRRAVSATFDIDGAALDELLAASQDLHADSVGVQGFTRAITDVWDESRRFELVVSLWRLALADGQIHHYEEHSIRRIADLLYLSHQRFIEAKLVAKRTGA